MPNAAPAMPSMKDIAQTLDQPQAPAMFPRSAIPVAVEAPAHVAVPDGNDEPEIVEMRTILKSPPKAGGAYRVNPETFFGPVIASLLATGITVDNLKSSARQAYQSCLELAEEVSGGAIDQKFAIKNMIEKLNRKRLAADQEAIAKNAAATKKLSDIGALQADDPRMEKYQKELLDLKRETQAAKAEHFRLEKVVLPLLYKQLSLS